MSFISEYKYNVSGMTGALNISKTYVVRDGFQIRKEDDYRMIKSTSFDIIFGKRVLVYVYKKGRKL